MASDAKTSNSQSVTYQAKQRELDVRLRRLVVKERTLLADIIALLKEIDRRQVYLELGYPSLFEYLVSGVGYSEGAAQRRIDAARLMADLPDLHERVMRGTIKLNQAAMIQKASREVLRLQRREVSVAEKREILKRLEGQTHAESQKIVASFLSLPGRYETRQATQADGSVRIEVTLSREVYEKMIQAQEKLAHVLPTGDIGQFIEYLVEKAVKQKALRKEMDDSLEVMTAANVAVTPTLREQVRRRDKVCQYFDPVTQRKCGGRWALQIDHIHPLFLGGANDIGNLQWLCAKHNRLKYKVDRMRASHHRTER
ncbi:MAG: HNH endonuclease [Bdellovibrionales bacterium]|nr:HNH endonuclease [Bdellovibrionales bacterium]